MFGTNLPYPAGSPDHLWFYYVNNNRTFMLDGQGVTAEVVEPDIGATNGVIHVIGKSNLMVNTKRLTECRYVFLL